MVEKGGRPPVIDSKMKVFCVRLSYDELEILRKLAEDAGETMSDILRKGIEIQRNMLGFH